MAVGVKRIAKVLGLTSARRVQQLTKRGMPKASRGEYEELACLRWYVKYLKKRLQARRIEEIEEPPPPFDGWPGEFDGIGG